jgi:hypothetical protein
MVIELSAQEVNLLGLMLVHLLREVERIENLTTAEVARF